MGMLIVALIVAYFGGQVLFWLLAYIGISNDTQIEPQITQKTNSPKNVNPK